MFMISPKGILALVAVLMCWLLALWLFRVGARDSVARKLALLLVFEGITLGSSDSIMYFMVSPEETFRQYPWLTNLQLAIHTFGDCCMLAFYPPFLAAALQTRLTRPFSRKPVRLAVVAVSVLLYITVNAKPGPYTISALYLGMSLVFMFALVASIQAWRLAEGAARSRARIFTLAFGFRDICWGFIYSTGIWFLLFGSEYTGPHASPDYSYIIYVLGTLVAVPLIAYGILKTQLFDIDLKIRWTIKQSTLAGIIVATVFLVSEGASEFLSSELGAIPGLLAAAVLMFFLAPLQAFAERVASAAMPNTKNTPEYVTFRKFQVYEAAVSEALMEGGISAKERNLLVHLRDSLGISESDARAIEAQLESGPGTLRAAAAS
jgi:hypothetical protein